MTRSYPVDTFWPQLSLALLAVAAAAVVRIAFLGQLGPRIPYVTFFPAVMFAALLGGSASGLIATAASALAAIWLQTMGQPFLFVREDWLAMGVFVLSCVALSWFSQVLHGMRLRAAEADALRGLVAERDQAEEARRRGEELLHEIGRMARVGGWEHDLATGKGAWTRELYHILEHEGGEPPGPGEHLDYYPPEDRERLALAMGAAVSHGKPFDLELQGFTLKRRPIWVRVIGRPVFQDGRCVRIFGSLQDISDRKLDEELLRRANQEAQAASRSKSDFLANMSHEIRTPLTAILGLTELCRRVRDPEKVEANLGMIEDSARLLLAIVGDVLDISRIEAGKLALEDLPFEPRQVLEKTLDAHRLALRGKDVDLNIDVAENVPRLLRGDPVRLGQVLGNLVGNAVKFTRMGFVRVRAEAAPEDAEGRVELRITVSDTGIGIPPELHAAVFDCFRQADSTFSKTHQGVGLGLAICRELTALMGGRVWVESEPGKGSSFHFTARFGVERASPGEAAPEAPRCGESPAPRRVLVAEDNPVNRHVFEQSLTAMGHGVATARDGREALDLLAREPFDLVLMDVQMPGLDGVETVRRLREGACGERAARTPVIALTAYAMAGDRERFIAAGMTDYLSKPVKLDALAEAVTRHCGAAPRPALAMAALLPEAVAYIDARLALARERLAAGDLPGAAMAAHDIKGTAMGLELAGLVKPASAFEKACREADAALAEVLAAEVASALDAARAAL